MKPARFAFLVSLFLLFAQCESDNAQPVNTLGTEVELSMTEFIDQDRRNLTLKFLTRKDFPCINYQIKHQLFSDDQSIRIILEKVEEADVCLDAIGPASAFVELGNLPHNDYNLTIQLGESVVKSGTLTVSKDAYQVDLHDTEGISLATPELRRVPQQTIWGSLKYESNESHKDLIKFFEQSLDQAGANEKKFAEGDYGYFRVGADGKILQQAENRELAREHAFIFDFGGDAEDIESVLKQVNQKYEGVQVRIYDNQGREYRNWDMH